KVLAICGGIHARTSITCPPDSPFAFPQDHPVTKIWPSFAAAVQIDNPGWRVRSVRIEPHGGTYFATISTDKDPTPKSGIHSIRSKKVVEEAIARPLTDEYWNWQLDLPRATAATFSGPQAASPPKIENQALREELLKREHEDQQVRNEL